MKKVEKIVGSIEIAVLLPYVALLAILAEWLGVLTKDTAYMIGYIAMTAWTIVLQWHSYVAR